MVTLILTCAGKGERAKFEKNKLLVPFNGKTTLERTLSVFLDSGLVDKYIVTSSKEDYEEIKKLVFDDVLVVLGGKTRTESVKNALKHVDDGIVLIHDGARPFVTKKIIYDCIQSVKEFGSGITAINSRDTLCFATNEQIENYVGKDNYYSIQTPQGFFSKDILKAYEMAKNETFNDDSEVYKKFIKMPHIVNGSIENIKLTYPEDFNKYSTFNEFRVGIGFDCHKLVEGRKLILGGIEIPHIKGLLGHSDADVLTHAIMDAILSGAGLRDIGYYFPDTDLKYKDADSIELLKEVLIMIEQKGYKVNNVSATIMAEKPKLLNYIKNIIDNLAKVIGIDSNNIGILATTLEGLGFVGREEGICVYANVSLIEK